MHVTLHLTAACNLKCNYCYAHCSPVGHAMTNETAFQAIRFAAETISPNIGVIFFGGEPLMKLDVIKNTIQECKKLEAQDSLKYKFHYKITTNGVLMDEEFLQFAAENNIIISLSIDGTREAHNTHRILKNGKGSFDLIEPKISKLLQYQPYANALMVVSPENVDFYYESVKFLVEKGFVYIISALNYAGDWKKEHLAKLEKQYKLLAKYYRKLTLKEHKFFFSPFEMKLTTHIKGKDILCTDCHLTKKQVSIAPNGDIYPCVQFVQDGISNTEFVIGDVWNGFDQEKRSAIYNHSQEENTCTTCALKSRCNYKCSCLNWQTTGILNQASSILCESEKILIPIVDELGEELFRKKSPLFIQKHYNTVYPLFSLMEDEIWTLMKK